MTLADLDVFLHIPKTAGTSFNTYLAREYRAQATLHVPSEVLGDGAKAYHAKSPAAQQAVRLVKGHISHGINRSIDRNVRYFTMLRDPQGRIVSYLNHMVSEAALHPEDDSAWYDAIRNWRDFETYAALRPRQVDNQMVRVLSGVDFAYGACSDEILQVAMQNLDAMPAFGTYGYLNESIILLRRAFGWRALPVMSRSKSKNRKRIVLTQQDKAFLQALNTFDARLYQYASDRLRQQIEADRMLRISAGINRSLTPAVTLAERCVRGLRNARAVGSNKGQN